MIAWLDNKLGYFPKFEKSVLTIYTRNISSHLCYPMSDLYPLERKSNGHLVSESRGCISLLTLCRVAPLTWLNISPFLRVIKIPNSISLSLSPRAVLYGKDWLERGKTYISQNDSVRGILSKPDVNLFSFLQLAKFNNYNFLYEHKNFTKYSDHKCYAYSKMK